MALLQGSLVTTLCLSLLATQGESTTIECSNPAPGVRKMVRGVDITTLDIVPLEIVGSNGFKNPIVNFTCNRGRKWRCPRGTEYQLPDQVWHMTTVPGGWLSADTRLYKTYREVKKSMSNNVGVEGTFGKFGFSASASYTTMQNTITNSSRFVSDTSAFASATRVDFIPYWILKMDQYAQVFVDHMITGTFESNSGAYRKFIQEFGTHYFASGSFGGYIRSVNEINTDYLSSKSDREVKVNAKASYLNIISVHGGHVSSSTTVDSKFKKDSTQSVKYYGGNTNMLVEKGIQKWQPTVHTDPWLFSGSLRPISNLITDKTKKASMIMAVYDYVMRKYLDEPLRLIHTARARSNDAVLKSLESRINALKQQDILKESDVEPLNNEVEHQLVVPTWFTSNTHLCYKWRPDDDAGQCWGPSRLLCAKPNAMTPVYRDDTDDRDGGCRMQWGIQSHGFPSWFSQVRVCYRWYPDDDPGECGGGAARLLCAGINEYSPEYRDDTDGRSGGCRMSWRIEVPSSAPLWMRTVKLCYSWYPDDDPGQCGPAQSRNMCAVANKWTPYYRDDTEGRDGGCRMTWGLKVGA